VEKVVTAHKGTLGEARGCRTAHVRHRSGCSGDLGSTWALVTLGVLRGGHADGLTHDARVVTFIKAHIWARQRMLLRVILKLTDLWVLFKNKES
jgi:hypothetical protein